MSASTETAKQARFLARRIGDLLRQSDGSLATNICFGNSNWKLVRAALNAYAKKMSAHSKRNA